MAGDLQAQKLCMQFIESLLETNPNKPIPVDNIVYQCMKRYNASNLTANRVLKYVAAGLGAEIDRANNTVTLKQGDVDGEGSTT